MKFKKPISILVILIAVLSLFASVYGVFSSYAGQGPTEFNTLFGNTVKLYGKGLYQANSISVASQGIAQDVITIILAIPLLIISLLLYRKGLLKGKLLLAGTLGYFLYTYISYVFLWMYNSFFLIYVVIMSASLYSFILTMMSFDLKNLNSFFSPKTPVRFLAGFLFTIAAVIGLMWLGMIVNPLLSGTVPPALEHYTTMVIQAMDLGFVVPTAILGGVLILKRNSFGYLLTSVMIIKGLSLGTALTAMVIGQLMAGVTISTAMIIIFPVINLFMIYCMYLVIKNIKEPAYR